LRILTVSILKLLFYLLFGLNGRGGQEQGKKST